MTEKTKNILSLNHTEAMDFFLKSEQYHGFELPEYFVFDDLLQNVKDAVGKTPYEECLQEGMSPELGWSLCSSSYYSCKSISLLLSCQGSL